MPTYTVHAPPPRPDELKSDPERFLFVRDGFYFWAFLLAPLWLLAKRLWLVLVLYIVLNIALGVTLKVLHAPPTLPVIVNFLIALLIGFEAGTLWRWTLARRRWRVLGFAVGDDQESAERRFFGEWTRRAPPASRSAPEPHVTAPVRRGPPSSSDVIGLFPEPER
jgi:Protein of unknown function (DUF2628)